MLKNILQFLIFGTLSFWLGCVVLTDFVIVRTLFSEIDDFFKAGFIGVQLFSKLNLLEIILASIIFLSEIFILTKEKKLIHLLPLFLILYGITFFDYIYLTPKLSDLTHLWFKADLMGVVGLPGIADIQAEHQKFHELYITLDSVKIFLLLTSLSILTWKNSKNS